jgi:hypothetical protein
MKKLFAIMLLLVYGLSSSGMTIHFHYCCGKLKKVDLTSVKDDQCGTKHKMGSKPCCDHKQVSLKLKAEQNPAKAINYSFSITGIKPVQPEYQVSTPIETKKLIPEVFAPPPLQKDFNHLYCIYRI